jgi:hypothetical protein
MLNGKWEMGIRSYRTTSSNCKKLTAALCDDLYSLICKVEEYDDFAQSLCKSLLTGQNSTITELHDFSFTMPFLNDFSSRRSQIEIKLKGGEPTKFPFLLPRDGTKHLPKIRKEEIMKTHFDSNYPTEKNSKVLLSGPPTFRGNQE